MSRSQALAGPRIVGAACDGASAPRPRVLCCRPHLPAPVVGPHLCELQRHIQVKVSERLLGFVAFDLKATYK